MSSAKVINFLNSIGIDETDSFDFEFGSLKKLKNTNIFEFEIIKDTLWDLDLLNYFIERISSVTKYEYHLKFKYKVEVTGKDVVALFKKLYFSTYFEQMDAKIEIQNNVILFESENQTNKILKIVTDFRNLINFINYPSYSIINQKIETIEEIESSMDEIIEEEIEEPISEDRFDDYSFEEDNSFDDYNFEEEAQNMIEEESNSFIEENRYMEKRLEGLDHSKNYHDASVSDLTRENLYVVCDAEIFSIETKELRNGHQRFLFGVHDGMDCIYLSVIDNKKMPLDFLFSFKEKDLVRFTGITERDKYMGNELIVRLTSMIKTGVKPLRDDNAKEKRVELHLHSKMSNMDGVGSIYDYAALAAHMGHKAIAITDHGVVQGFPDAQIAAKKAGIKMLYGSELYVVDDAFVGAYNPNDNTLSDMTYVVFDLETTGLSMKYDKIIEFGAVKVQNGLVRDRLDILINPERLLPKKIIEITKITNEDLRKAPTIDQVIDQIMEFIGDATLVSHNLEFDYGFLNEALIKTRGIKLVVPAIDTLAISRYLNPEAFNHRLGALCRRNEVFYDEDAAHRADYDAEVLSKCWFALCYTLGNQGLNTLSSIATLKKEAKHIKHSRESHMVVLAQNDVGLKNLYKIISLSHIEFLGRVPCVPRSKLQEYREGLLVGSACFNGDVFDAASRLSDEMLDERIKFYDYIELQPISNYSYILNMEYNGVSSMERLLDILNSIVKYAKKNDKLIVATGDCHYVNPEDKIFRDVYVYAAGVGKTSHPLRPFAREKMEEKGVFFDNPDQHFRSTEEMLEEFKVFGEENAFEWVVTNTNKIADMCESLMPVKDKLFTPTIDNCENMLRDICYETAHKLYGENLPEIVEARLEKELNGIITNGYSVIYYIAHKIIKKSNEDGYIVGSRGSVGSSFVATMANITEVNPLPPHYRCPHCKHFELYEGDQYFSGYDLPSKKCPVCGEEMIGDGQNIPFETFLGFNADKVPDIDLNFPPDYQAKAHNYTKVLLGEKNVFRAGTIGTVAEKTAFGHARGYFERRFGINGQAVPKAKTAYLASGCKDVKRTTGQHPGGIVVIPREFDVYDFTPIQFPADDLDAEWMTTHFDFHAIHDTVLKLDLLGHVDPQALKFMCDQFGTYYMDIPLGDRDVISIFSKPDALKLQHNYLNQKNGALAIPEFGTDFVRGLLDQTKPTTFADLLIISGLSHGTNVWRNNADELIASGTTDLRGVIGCRDDIMTTLIKLGVPKLASFTLMEKVRKGKGLTADEEKLLRDNNVPEYYIESCKKIKYLFPKAHATAYVTMAIRVGWFKVHHPLIFYAGFFSVRCDKYDWEAMYKGPEAIMNRLKELETLKREHPNDYSKKYEEIEKTLNVSLEMYDRGIKFSNLSIYKSDDKNFIVDEETNSLIPPFKVIDGLGEAAAQSIIEARKDGKFTSIENFEKRTKINQTQLEIFKAYGLFDGMSNKDIEQMSLFDFGF